jgi:DNA-binding GntR family transcriptional regulator
MVHLLSQPWSPDALPTEHLSYRGIADDLTERIRSGEYPPGSRLPSTAQLAELYSVNRSTVVRAAGLLHDRGLVRGIQGVGLFVANPLPGR